MDAELIQFVLGQLMASQLPPSVDLSMLRADIHELCSKSLRVAPGNPHLLRPPDDDQAEWGGCIVMADGSLHVVDHVKGTATAVASKCDPKKHNPRPYVGFAHTHLPDDTGIPYSGFSERDFAATLCDGDKLALVCNGRDVFALVRTPDCTEPPRLPTVRELDRWARRYDRLIDCEKNTLAEALWLANRQMCKELGFAFYAGPWAQPLRLELIYRPTKGRNRNV